MASLFRLVVSAALAIFPLVSASNSQITQPRTTTTSSPTATIKNGTYAGLHNDYYNVDYFLGMPFAQPPINDLRLAKPVSLNSSFSGVRNATTLGPGCMEFQAAGINRPLSEDCLSINVIRPSGYENEKLPVVVWIFGGGLTQGLNADPRYNLTFTVANAVKMGKPIVAASINYRLGGWGFLEAPVIRDAGLSNIGLYDQRLALHWVQENIAAFSGDPAKVTLWGQSAGGASVGAHTVAFGGRNDSLFRGVIAHSGGPNGFQPPTAARSLATFNSILNLTGCASATDSIACLRKVPTDTYTSAVNGTTGTYGLVADGVWFETVNSKQTSEGKFVRVPLLLGSNVDEGTNFVGGAPYIGALPTISYNASAFLTAAAGYVRNASVSDGAVAALSVLYPDIPAIGIPHSHHGRLNDTFGASYARVATLAGDVAIHRGRRLSAQMWAKYGVPVYSFDFTAWPIGGLDDFVGTTHFTEIQLAFDNENGDGYLAPWYKSGSEFAGQGQALVPLARLMNSMWISFIYDQTPNNHGICTGHNGFAIPTWPTYAANASDATEGYGVNMRFDPSLPALAAVTPDTYRAEAIGYLIANSASIFGA